MMKKDQNPTHKPSKKPFGLLNRLFVALQYALPHHLLSALVYRLARSRWEPLKKLLIEQAIRRFEVDMSLAENPDPNSYASFNEFFTRALRADARPMPNDLKAICCPVDGRVSQFGRIKEGRIFQAKGHSYSVEELLGGDEHWTRLFHEGEFINIYLSPKDYHRIHSPRHALLHRTIHIPGRLFSVNPVTTRAVPRLFARNERLCCLFESDTGPMAVILVGAIFVSSIETLWGGEHVSPKEIAFSEFAPPALTPELQKGEELGRFNMGSTVILLFGKGHVHWADKLKPGMHVRMGQRIGMVDGVASPRQHPGVA